MRPRFVIALVLVGCQGDPNAPNTPPRATIELPKDGTSYRQGEAVALRGVVADDETAAEGLSLRWTSDLDGELSNGAPDAQGVTTASVSGLSVGRHAVTLQVQDPEGLEGRAATTVLVDAMPPEPSLVILGPLPDADGFHGVEDDVV
ncbi:MAG: hypothetical protein AAF602_01310, partial [Myxococcota bacterium]